MEYAQRIECAFTTQADAFEDPGRNRVFTTDERWVFERLRDPSHPRMLAAIDMDGETATGLRPRPGDDGDVWFTQTFASAIAVKPA